jgi:large subunit ribosomal protein L2
MTIRKLKPKTSSQRFRIANTFKEVTTSVPYKQLTKGIYSSGGRNNTGKITIRYRGGGHKRKYRIIDFKRDKINMTALVKSIEYDPNRSSFIALLYYSDGSKRYIIAQKGLQIGQKVISVHSKVDKQIGNATILKEIPLGTIISCLELSPGKGAVLARSAGCYAKLVAKEGKYAIVKLPSGATRMILIGCMATIGVVSNFDHKLEKIGKAGRNRWLGKRPRTRAVAMNPIDHPMGGGEGKASGGHPRTKYGIPSKGYKTRSKKKSNKFILKNRKK